MWQPKSYDHQAVEIKWQKIWRQTRLDEAEIDDAKKPFYNLMMFPYPSAEGLHIGNTYAFTGSDIYGRFKRMQGFDVFEPIGLDGFGIHSENYAFKVGRHPMDHAAVTEKNFYRQLDTIGCMFDRKRVLETYNSNYYRWTQWLFVQMFKHELAYRRKAKVNWCPSCKTVLADEQVITGKCERCGNIVENRLLEQWFFRITAYAEKLLDNLRNIDWSQKVKVAQQNWIGKSRGMMIKFRVLGLRNQAKDIEVFTSRPDTLFGITFMALSIDYPGVLEMAAADKRGTVKQFLADWRGKKAEDSMVKEGLALGVSVVNPVNKKVIPLWVTNYVAGDYGTGAVMGVPAHDSRDFAFAKKYEIDIVRVISGGDLPYVGEGSITASGDWNGWLMPKDIVKVMDWLEQKKMGRRMSLYHLRDWLVSRQRYWGAPIPMVFCKTCANSGKGEQKTMPGWYSVPESELPVLLPRIEDYKPRDDGVAPLAKHKEFYATTCPGCKEKAVRETDVCDTFLDSSWYFLRYPSVASESADAKPFDPNITKKWLPVSMYTGGAEHSVLHLMYSRFITMALHDWGMLGFEEPFTRFFAHGLVIKEGAKMSKSKGNIVNPDDYIRLYGADALRLYLMFMGPFDQGGDFRDAAMEGMARWVKRVWRLAQVAINGHATHNPGVDKALAKLIKKVSEDTEKRRYNTAIASMMEFTNLASDKQAALTKNQFGVFVRLLAPYAPYLTEELYQRLRPGSSKFKIPALPDFDGKLSRTAGRQNSKFESVHRQPWPSYRTRDLLEERTTIIVQVNGRLRDSLNIKHQVASIKEEVENMARTSPKVQKYLAGQKVKQVVFIPGKLINFVV